MAEPAMVGKPKMPKPQPQPQAVPTAKAPGPSPAIPKTPMQLIADLMEPNSYSILIGLMNFANFFQEAHNASQTGEGGIKMSDDFFKFMVTPFTGFGANPMVWQQMSHAIVPQLMTVILQWRSDPAYREANTMPWLVLQTVAPTLANIDKGWEAAGDIYRILAEMKKIEIGDGQ